jgi:hypothetical protein
MKSSFSSATAVFRGFAGWILPRSQNALTDADHVPFVVSACGYRRTPDTDAQNFDMSGNEWVPGVSLDNFS